MNPFDQVIHRENTNSVRWDKYPRGVIPLWVADMDFRVPECITQALQRRITHPIYGYTHASEELKEAIVDYLLEEYGYRIEKGWIVFLPSVVSGLHMAARNLLEPSDHAIIPSPAYHHFQMALQGAHRAYSYYSFKLINNRWAIDLEALEKSIQANTRIVMVCNPHNPGGTVFTEEEVARLTALAKEHNFILCSDEIHADLRLDAGIKHIPMGMEASARDLSISLMSLNKAYNFPGIGLGWAVIANPSLRARFAKGLHTLIPGPNLFAYEATLAAIQAGKAWHRDLIDYLRQNRDLVQNWVQAEPGLRMAHLPATYLAWIDASSMAELDVMQAFLAAGVAVSPGEQFGKPHFFRLNFGTSRIVLQQALERMSGALRQLR